nr:MAG TPA: hypothetical protein [Caudoviricetes sp.]
MYDKLFLDAISIFVLITCPIFNICGTHTIKTSLLRKRFIQTSALASTTKLIHSLTMKCCFIDNVNKGSNTKHIIHILTISQREYYGLPFCYPMTELICIIVNGYTLIIRRSCLR